MPQPRNAPLLSEVCYTNLGITKSQPSIYIEQIFDKQKMFDIIILGYMSRHSYIKTRIYSIFDTILYNNV